MTERPDDRFDVLEDAELELITDYLTGQLPAERVAEVKHRLEHDPEFIRIAAPLVTAWTVKPLHVREPMPRAELAKHWQDFTQRAGFIHQPRKTRRGWWLLLSVIVIGTTLGLWLNRSREPQLPAQVPYETLTSNTSAPLRLRDGTLVQLATTARLQMATQWYLGTIQVTYLFGSAIFHVRHRAGDTLRTLVVVTPFGVMRTSHADFSVTTHGDTTDVHVLSGPRMPGRPADIPNRVTVSPAGGNRGEIVLHEGEFGRVIQGTLPVALHPRGVPVTVLKVEP